MKTKQIKFTFKNAPKVTGLARVCATPYCTIKYKGEIIGFITGNEVWFRIHGSLYPEDKSGWKNVKYKSFDSFIEAKQHVRDNTDTIYHELDLHVKYDVEAQGENAITEI